MPVRALVRAGALFGIAENSIRVALTRLLARGLVERDERGAYRLGAGAARGDAAGCASWRASSDRIRTWAGGWIAVHTRALRAPIATARSAARARAPLPRLPRARARPRGPARQSRRRRRGDARAARRARPRRRRAGVRARELDAATDARARLWDATRSSPATARRSPSSSAASATSQRLGAEDAMVESFLARRPRDPPARARSAAARADRAGRERDALVDAMRRYDALGRAAGPRS